MLTQRHDDMSNKYRLSRVGLCLDFDITTPKQIYILDLDKSFISTSRVSSSKSAAGFSEQTQGSRKCHLLDKRHN